LKASFHRHRRKLLKPTPDSRCLLTDNRPCCSLSEKCFAAELRILQNSDETSEAAHRITLQRVNLCRSVRLNKKMDIGIQINSIRIFNCYGANTILPITKKETSFEVSCTLMNLFLIILRRRFSPPYFSSEYLRVHIFSIPE
jgi:hypothetical protein